MTASGDPSGRPPRISVCLATYNGAAHVREQLESILADLGPGDEVVVVDDASRDETVALLEGLDDERVRVVRSPHNQGHVKTFERAIDEASGDIIMLSDQDDVWPLGRTETLSAALKTADLAAGNYAVLGDESTGPVPPLAPSMDGRGLRNVLGLILGRRPYYGSCMAFRSDLRSLLLPFPRAVEAHDHWLAVVGNIAGHTAHPEGRVTLRRVHAGNLSPARRRGPGSVARTRIRLVVLSGIAVARAARTRQGHRA
jgi:glycosyltransferase involved in cell wall biosynthesis